MPLDPIAANGKLRLTSERNSLAAAESQGEFRKQVAVLTDMVRQLVGDAAVASGSTAPMDPLVAPFTLYVNPYIGSDRFVAGSFNDYELADGTDAEKIAAKLKRVHNQALACGYSPQRPFKTLNRAAIEAAIITSRAYFTFKGPDAHLDCVLIRTSAGRHIIYNDPGPTDAATITAWADGFVPAAADLVKFNDPKGGLLLPRAASFNGDDLRKTTFAYNWAPPATDELPDYSNRFCVFRVTPLALGGQFTFVDKLGQAASVHLLDCFQNVSKAQLDLFYSKVFKAVGSGANLSAALTVTRKTEYQVVGPIQGIPAPEWDTTASASPYMFNCSIRSDWGLCGVFLDGDNTEGLDSLVTAQFTGVSLQKDMNCWEIYKGGNWVTPTYAEYINVLPDNLRMKPTRRSRHLTVINDAFVQAVSVFCIGQGVGYMTDNGGEITVTNSNSSFGGCAALSKGYKQTAFRQDRNWTVSAFTVPLSPETKRPKPSRTFLGKVQALTASLITLALPTETSGLNAPAPYKLERTGHTLKAGTLIWLENPSGDDYYATLAADAWNATAADQIRITGDFRQSGTGAVLAAVDAVDKRIYTRRISDSRLVRERRVSMQILNTTPARIPERNFILQTNPLQADGQIARELNRTNELIIVSRSGVGQLVGTGTSVAAEVTLRTGNTVRNYATGEFYLSGTTVTTLKKHFVSTRDVYATGSVPAAPDWIETFVHQPENFNAEDNQVNEAPVLNFDTDTDPLDASTSLGINWPVLFTAPGPIRDRYRAGVDYRGTHAFLAALGFTATDAHTLLLPAATEAERRKDPAVIADFPMAPSSGAAAGRGNWAVEFRRPSVLRLYGHAWEWAGWTNYSKSLPAAQQGLSSYNKFTYYFTNEAGGRVVPQGSNEEGFNITPRGLQDIETGEEIKLGDISSPEVDLPSIFENVTIQDLTVIGKLDLSQVTNLISNPDLFPYLPYIGDPRADIVLRSLGIGGLPEDGFGLSLTGSAKGSVVAVGSVNTIDCRAGNFFKFAMASNRALTFINTPAVGRYSLTLEIIYSAGALTLPASVRHLYGIVPTLTLGKTYHFVLSTTDGGARWLCDTREWTTA